MVLFCQLNLDMFFASRFALAGHPEEAQAKRVLKQLNQFKFMLIILFHPGGSAS